MFKNTYQSGFLSILFAGGSKPLGIWGQEVRNGHIRRVTDEDVQSLALEIMGTNVATTYIICPSLKNHTLGIRLPFFIMIVKNMKKYFTFEITVLDDKNMSRRFRVSNYQSTTRVRPFSTCLPIGLTGGWNQIQFNLADFTRRAYGSSYIETLRVQIHANVRIRRIYFSDRLYAEDEMPQEFKLYVPITSQKDKGKGAELKIAMEDKSTGADKVRKSIEMKVEETEVEITGVPPTPTDVERGSGAAAVGAGEGAAEVLEEGMEASAAAPQAGSEAEDEYEGEDYGEVLIVAPDVEGGEEAGAPVEDAGEGGVEGEVEAAPVEAEAPAEGEAPAEVEAPPADAEAPSEDAPAEAPAE